MFEEINLKSEEVSKTANDKIYVKQSNGYDAKMLFKDIARLELLLRSENADEIYEQVKRLVPTFNYETKHRQAEKEHIYDKKAAFETNVL